ncbi:hypothetical protein A3D85_01175 [Candidatus Amesbacteria bacterium RIFCSPHIGHO2_02_FULL_47_9]|uniref:DUF5660 domain-containing protein n=1 Tax=Candidatus Amesbacteria bacterium RIFCSPHIGHO2_01_FULL_48_32b TaxID=1797253 RepID=A0A1F4YG07_9BACT|nr:MAG: hypothetical protein A2876_01970 [Candidatus Amesbacteria bacterium RIFCSPHIGHO2_01_FULL_48_32b]OGD02419.1 MAG: hypothetical protein A3D85_01175 [Candidatus Amesbacteria bacterium RIFCSPHIGHO2_02_FULL_47_9]OGD08543.1 MAG: hypothetical protein A2899_03625 [Candidatus Amesbacteria bacterium RIFCSPLOWO2_01_FULL_49_25]
MSSKSQTKSPPKNFLEALRELGGDFKSEAKIQVTKIVTQDVPESFGFAPTGTLKPNEAVSVSDMAKAESRGEAKAESRFNARLAQIKEEERAHFARLEAQNKQQIQSILVEIKTLASATGTLASQVEVAVAQAPANPGVYHRNFFDQLLSFIKVLRQKVQDSSHWLATTNSRANKKSYYWGQVGKSGTSYMLSSERYMVTSTG